TFEAFDGYAMEDWDVFSASIKEAFGGAFQTKKCTRATLDSFIQVSAAELITTDTELRVYHRGFQGIVAYLITDKQLSEKDAARYYWFCFHPATQEQLERRLGIVTPNHPWEDLFAITDVYKAGCYIFNSHAFNLYSSPIMELNVKVAGQFNKVGLYDSGAELVCISKEAVKELNLPWNPDLKLNMRDVNGGTKTNTGVVENSELTIVGISIFVHAWIIEKAPYHLLLGRPFQRAVQ
ncbi:hypothetical protein JB92DRAFT_2586920, partial [Gautieria morchelliformis]